MYYMTYSNNDYRDYVLAHSLGEWTKPVKYIAKKVVNGVTRYIYEPTTKHITGSYYKKRMNQNLENMHRASDNRSRGNSERFDRERDSYRKNQAAYSRSLAGRLGAARSRIGSALKKAGTNIRNTSRALLERGRSLVQRIVGKAKNTALKVKGKVTHTVKKAAGAYKETGKSDASSYGRSDSGPMTKEQLEKKRKRANLGYHGAKKAMYFDKDNPGKAGKGGRRFYSY